MYVWKKGVRSIQKRFQGICSKRQTQRQDYTEYGSIQVPGEPTLLPPEQHTICIMHMFMQMKNYHVLYFISAHVKLEENESDLGFKVHRNQAI